MGVVTTEDVAKEPAERSVARLRHFTSEPYVRVNLVHEEPQLDFRVSGRFSVYTLDGEMVFDRIQSRRRWRIRVESSHQAKYDYGCLLKTLKNFEDAEAYQRKMMDAGHDTQIVKVGDILVLGGGMTEVDNTAYAVVLGWWDNIDETRAAYREAGFRCVFRLFRWRRTNPKGKIEIFDLDFERSEILNKGVVLKLSGTQARYTFLDIPGVDRNGNKFREQKECQGELEITIDGTGALSAVLVLPLEKYLAGIRTEELHPVIPKEALKSNIIALRGICLREMGRRHAGEDFDFCMNAHCRSFSGFAESDNKALKEAFAKTAGQALMHEGIVCESVTTRNCGGFTEDRIIGKDGSERSYLNHSLDSPKRAPAGFSNGVISADLVQKWVLKPYASNCYLQKRTDVPELLAFGRRYRWEVRASRQEIEASLLKRMKADVGILYDIVPIKWGKSGRIESLELIGSLNNVRIDGADHINAGLFEGGLPSACFQVQTVIGNEGEPVEFVFQGAGEGTGGGMCLTGAIGMALDKIKCEKILRQYYPETTLKKIY
jgi:SpoIID/LytB domain protein